MREHVKKAFSIMLAKRTMKRRPSVMRNPVSTGNTYWRSLGTVEFDKCTADLACRSSSSGAD